MRSAPERNFLRWLADGRLLWLLLLLPVALYLPALPIDETRYLAVAWEMRLHGDFLVPHLNGAPYSDKPPLLFWLINLGWLVAGMNAWAVRLGVLAASLASLLLCERLVRRLEPDRAVAERALWLFAGMIYFALFSSAIMFDVLLTTCVLVALHGTLDLDAQRWRRGTLLLALGFGLGILTKGPVALLDAGLAAALAPWWSATARAAKRRWYACLALGVLGGAGVALAWAIPAALAGGPEYANAIFLHQTVDRMARSFAHRRPPWWYLLVLPLMLLPWTLSLRAPWRAWCENVHIGKSARFAIAAFAPAFGVFCLVSGKQPHYLLPLLPALALYLALVLGDARAAVRGRPFAALLTLAGIALAALPYLAAHASAIAGLDRLVRDGHLTESFLGVVAGVWPWWGVALTLLGLGLLTLRGAHASLRALALAGRGRGARRARPGAGHRPVRRRERRRRAHPCDPGVRPADRASGLAPRLVRVRRPADAAATEGELRRAAGLVRGASGRHRGHVLHQVSDRRAARARAAVPLRPHPILARARHRRADPAAGAAQAGRGRVAGGLSLSAGRRCSPTPHDRPGRRAQKCGFSGHCWKRATLSRISRRAAAASSQPSTFTHFPFSRSL